MSASENDQLLRIPAIAQTRARLVQALADRHRLVLLLGEPASLVTFILHAASGGALEAGRLVHPVTAGRLRAQDLDHADRQIIVAIDHAADLSPPALRALDAHLRGRRPTQIVLAGPPSCRGLTRRLPALHLAPLVVPLPSLSEREAAAFLRLRGRAPSPRLLRAASGQAGRLERLAAARGPARLPELAHSAALAPILDRPAALLAVAIGLAAVAGATIRTPPAAPLQAQLQTPTPAPNPVPDYQLPPIEKLLPDTPAEPLVAGSAADPGAAASGIAVDREDPDDLLAPRRFTLRRGETLAALYARVYRGLTPPPLSVIRALNPHPSKADGQVILPAPDEGWPAP